MQIDPSKMGGQQATGPNPYETDPQPAQNPYMPEPQQANSYMADPQQQANPYMPEPQLQGNPYMAEPQPQSNPYGAGQPANPYMPDQYGANPYAPQGAQPGAYPPPQQPYYGKPQSGKGVGIAALVLGIVGFIVGLLPFAGMIFAAPIGIAAIVCAIVALVKNSAAKKLAIVGLVLAILGIPASFAMTWMGSVAIIEENGGNVNALIEAVENSNGNMNEEEMENVLFGENVDKYREMKNAGNENTH